MGSVLIGLKLMMKMTRLSAPGKDQGEGQQGRRHGGSLLETTQPVQADDAFYKQLAEASQSPAFVLRGDFNLPDVCWKYSRKEAA